MDVRIASGGRPFTRRSPSRPTPSLACLRAAALAGWCRRNFGSISESRASSAQQSALISMM
jgi:hypothetical protein